MMLKNMIRIGKVSSVNGAKGTVRVIIDDEQNIVTDELPLLSFEYYMPDPGDFVLCVFLGNGISHGFCLSQYFFDQNPPPISDPKIYHKRYFHDEFAFLDYNQHTKEWTVQAKIINIKTVDSKKINMVGDVKIDGDVQITGDVHVVGNITATGTITGNQ